MRDSFAKCVPVRAADKHVPVEDRSDVFAKRLAALNSHGRVRLPLFELVGVLVIDEVTL